MFGWQAVKGCILFQQNRHRKPYLFRPTKCCNLPGLSVGGLGSKIRVVDTQAQLPVTLSNIAAIIGMVLGTAGFVISWMNYVRDRPRVRVTLKWDMTDSATHVQMGLVKVVNVGRRPVFISIVSLELPKGFKETHLVLRDSIQGQKLSEGDAPAVFQVNYDGLQQYSSVWRKIRAYVEDSAGGEYHSSELAESDVPSWVRS